MINTHHTIRGVAHLNHWINDSGIVKMHSYRKVSEPLLVGCQLNYVSLDEITDLPDDDYFYIYRFWDVSPEKTDLEMPIIVTDDDGRNVVRALRLTKPVTVFEQYNSHPLYWYEFPIRKSVLNLEDPLVATRRVYKVKDLKLVLAQLQAGK